MTNHPIFKVSAGVLMGGVGVIMLITSGVMVFKDTDTIVAYVKDRPTQEEIAMRPVIPADTCVDRLLSLGLSGESAGEGKVQVKPEGITENENPLEEASSVATACPGYRLQSLCMGSECEGGMEMTLVSGEG